LSRLLEILFGLHKGFLGHGEYGVRFEPHWPGPLIGQSTEILNYLLYLIPLGLLIVLARPRKPRKGLQLALVAACVAIWPIALIIEWPTVVSFLVAILALAGIVYCIVTVRSQLILVLARISLFGMMLAVISGPLAWNLTLGISALLLVYYVYRREGRSLWAATPLAALRLALISFLLVLLNNPVLSVIHTLTEPSVVAVLVDHTMSMRLRDVGKAADNTNAAGPTRLEAAIDLFSGDQQSLMRRLAAVHTLKFYDFDASAHSLVAVNGPKGDEASEPAPTPGAVQDTGESQAAAALASLKPDGASTQITGSLINVLDELQGQHLAGIVVLTDGRETPTQPLADAFRTLARYNIRVYPIGIGSDKAPTNIEMQAASAQDSAFKDDLVGVKFTVRGTGYEANHPIHVRLLDQHTGEPLLDPDGKPAEKTITLADDRPVQDELLFKASTVGPLDVKVQAVPQPGEIDDQDNSLPVSVDVLDARISVLYVEGYPRWEYRYIKNAMIRDKTVEISCVLTSADPTFDQEHSDADPKTGFPGKKQQFPESMAELMPYDVILFGDVDPRYFTDTQLQLISDFVSKKGGGFGMIAGPRWSPYAYRNTPIDALLPVDFSKAVADDPSQDDTTITEGFRPVLTRDGDDSSIFRFFTDKAANEAFLKDDWQPLFWYCQGIKAKPGVGIVYAEHPTDLGPDGRKAPLLVLGQYGAGRTLFSAFDDSWRWRFYTGENVFDTYWIQNLRYLARGKKLGQRTITFAADRATYQLGEQATASMRVLDPVLLQQLPAEIGVQVVNDDGQVIRNVKLQRQEGQADYYTCSFPADTVGQLHLKVPGVSGIGVNLDVPMKVITPRLELEDPRVDHHMLSALAQATDGKEVALADARSELPKLLPSAARVIQLPYEQQLMRAPVTMALVMALFVLLVTAEWVLRKVHGML
jgi:uncharacterized membrane protein